MFIILLLIETLLSRVDRQLLFLASTRKSMVERLGRYGETLRVVVESHRLESLKLDGKDHETEGHRIMWVILR